MRDALRGFTVKPTVVLRSLASLAPHRVVPQELLLARERVSAAAECTVAADGSPS
jgi:hypothetical protein